MNTIECVFVGRLSSEPEFRTSAAGKPWASFSAAVGHDDNLQWVRVAVFGTHAKELAGTLHNGDRCYVQGRLKLNEWRGQDGKPKAGLQVAAWKCEPVGQIGERKPKRRRQAADTQTGTRPAAGAGDAAWDWQRPSLHSIRAGDSVMRLADQLKPVRRNLCGRSATPDPLESMPPTRRKRGARRPGNAQPPIGQVRIVRGELGFDAWLAHLGATGQTFAARYWCAQGYVLADSL